MNAKELFDEIKRKFEISSDADLALLLGMTGGRVSQMKKSTTALTPRTVASLLKKAVMEERSVSKQFASNSLRNAIQPAVEMYPISATRSKQDAKWEIFPTDSKTSSRNAKVRKCLESFAGVYFFFDSQGFTIYAGKTESTNVWKEMNHAFNRERSNHTAFLVNHPTNGNEFEPAWDHPRQPVKQIVYLHDTAHYFSAYKVAPELIPKLEALVIRSFCNILSNKKMEKL